MTGYINRLTTKFAQQSPLANFPSDSKPKLITVSPLFAQPGKLGSCDPGRQPCVLSNNKTIQNNYACWLCLFACLSVGLLLPSVCLSVLLTRAKPQAQKKEHRCQNEKANYWPLAFWESMGNQKEPITTMFDHRLVFKFGASLKNPPLHAQPRWRHADPEGTWTSHRFVSDAMPSTSSTAAIPMLIRSGRVP